MCQGEEGKEGVYSKGERGRREGGREGGKKSTVDFHSLRIVRCRIPAPYSGLHFSDSGSVWWIPLYGAGIRHRTIRSEWKSTVVRERGGRREGGKKCSKGEGREKGGREGRSVVRERGGEGREGGREGGKKCSKGEGGRREGGREGRSVVRERGGGGKA